MNWLQKISTGYYGLDSYYNGYWVDPAGTIMELEDTHHSWIHQNKDLLSYNYDIEIDEWFMQYLEDEEREHYSTIYENKVRDVAFERDIDESQVELSDDEQEEVSIWAQESAQGPNDVELVDYLIKHGWIRVSQKNAKIHIEGNEEGRGFWDKVEMILIKLFPKAWSNTNYAIIINNQEIYSGDMQEAGSVHGAIAKNYKNNGWVMHQR